MWSSVADKIVPAYLIAAEELRENPEQWKAYESKGNFVVLAGPGSGKTKVLTVKMARMSSENVEPPRGIACITFNSECVRELKRRLDLLGIRESPNTLVNTIHSFCLKGVLLHYATLAGVELPTPLAVASPSEQDRLFAQAVAREISADEPPSTWRVRADRYRRTYLDRESSEWRNGDEQVALLIESYERLLRANGLIDFDDMVLLGLHLIEKHQWVRDALRARFPILIVDEYQDLGLPLHRIVLSLCLKGRIRLLAVGDPDQSIYGFTGAKPELLTELSEMEQVESVRLRFNYRSGKTIIDASEAILGESRAYEARSIHKGTIDFYECPLGLQEQAEMICNSIIPEALSREPSLTLADIAVLYLDRYDGDVIAGAAERATLKFVRIDQGSPYRKTPLTRWLEDCAAWCAGGWRKGTPRLSSLIGTWLGFNRSVTEERQRQELKTLLVQFLFQHRLPAMRLVDWLNQFGKTCLSNVMTRESTLRDEAEALTKLSEACDADGKLAELTVGTFAGQAGSPDHLNLITLHSAKGLEFEIVIMMGMEQGRIPPWWATSSEAKREPRRLFYVGLTRAKREVHMTYSGWTTNRYGHRFDNGPSEFLLEVQKRMNVA
jgi:DNA helicase-2/ATP-dependent DNA helicase PcrA